MNKIQVILFIILAQFSIAQVDSLSVEIEEVVVTATKTNTEKTKIANPVYVISQADLKNNPASTLGELLNQIPGLHVQESYGNAGSPQQYSLRGGRAKDVLILIDGMPISDDSQIQNFQDLNLVSLQNIEKIEVQTGGATTYYGSNAAAGVINIITKNDAPLINVQASLGNWNGKQAAVATHLPISEKVSANASFMIDKIDGFSAARDKENTGSFDVDGSQRNLFQIGLQYQPTNRLQLSFTSSFNHHDFDFDGGAYVDAQNQQENKQSRQNLHADWKNKLGKLTANGMLIVSDRKQYNPFGRTEDQLYSRFESAQTQIDLFQNIEVMKKSNLLVGLYSKGTDTDQAGIDFFSGNFENNLAKDTANFHLLEPYFAFQLKENKTISLDVGARYHSHSDYESQLVYHVKPIITIVDKENVDLQWKGAYSTSYNTPSLYQLYSVYGNQALKPEKSHGGEGTITLTLFDKFKFASTAYLRKEENLLGFSNTTFKYANLDGESDVKGWETTFGYNEEKWNANLFWAGVERDEVSDLWRLPSREWGVNAALQPIGQMTLSTHFRHVGERVMPLFNSSTFTTDEFTMQPYNQWNATATYQLPKGVKLFGSVQNILDDEIIDNLGYNWRERNVSVGAKWVFEK